MSLATATILIALAASVSYGVSDVVSGAVVRRHTVASVAFWAQVAGLAIITTLVAVHRPPMTVSGLLLGIAAGVVASLAILLFYTALQRGRTAVVVPIAGCGALVPVVYGTTTGEPAGGPTIAGLAVTILGIIVVSTGEKPETAEPGDGSPDGPRQPAVPGRSSPMPLPDGCRPAPSTPTTRRTSVWMAIAAAAAFGTFFVLLDMATGAAVPTARGDIDTALSVGLAVQAGAFAVTLVAVTRHAPHCLRPSRKLIAPAITIGVLDVAADLAVTYAITIGPVAVVGPLASLDPVVSVLIVTVVLRERLSVHQFIGVAMALLGTGLVAW
jgi:drug/metabolite transporter (DMT)-like permease